LSMYLVLHCCDLVVLITPEAKPMARRIRRWTLGSLKLGVYAICCSYTVLYSIVVEKSRFNGEIQPKKSLLEKQDRRFPTAIRVLEQDGVCFYRNQISA